MQRISKSKRELLLEVEKLDRQIEETRSASLASLEAEATMWEGQLALAVLLNNLPGVAYRVATGIDGHGKAVFVSQGCLGLTGHPPATFFDDDRFFYDQVIHHDDRAHVLEQLFSALQSASDYRMTYRIIAADGTLKWVAENGTVIVNNVGVVVAREGFITDVTGSLQPLQRLQARCHHLESVLAETAEGDTCHQFGGETPCFDVFGGLAGGIAHDLNNVLQAVIGYTKLAGNLIDADTREAGYLQSILVASDRASQLTDRLLSFCGSGTTLSAPVVLGPLFEEIQRMLRCSCPETVSIEISVPPLPLVAVGEAGRICQVIVALASALVSPIKSRGGTLNIVAGVARFDPEHPPPSDVLDDGDYIFVELSAKRSSAGETGTIEQDAHFGLSIPAVEALAEALEGTVVLGGTHPDIVPTVYLCALDASHAPADDAPPIPPAPHEILPGGVEHILFVDDEVMLVELGQLIAEDLGYRVTVTTSSLEALRMFEKNPGDFDVVVTDQTMPALTGSELSAKLLEIRRDIPIILTTGYSEMVSELKARQIGIHEFLMKPITPEVLAEALRNALDR